MSISITAESFEVEAPDISLTAEAVVEIESSDVSVTAAAVELEAALFTVK